MHLLFPSHHYIPLPLQAITIQAALLYTSSNGERRIRVHTMVLPVTNSLTDMLDSVDIDCAVNILAKQAVEVAQKTGTPTILSAYFINTSYAN